MKKLNAGNLLAGARSSTLIAGLFIVLIVSIVLLFANFAYINTQSNYDTEYIGHAGELRVLSQRIAKNSTEAAAGTAEAFGLLRDARNDFQARWNILTDGSEETVHAGDVYYWPPGHTVSVSEAYRSIEFSPREEMAHLVEHLRSKLGA